MLYYQVFAVRLVLCGHIFFSPFGFVTDVFFEVNRS